MSFTHPNTVTKNEIDQPVVSDIEQKDFNLSDPFIRVYEGNGDRVEAAKVTAQTAHGIAEWCDGEIVEEIDPFDSSKRFPALNLETLEGRARASIGWYVVRSERGAFYVIWSTLFERTYKEV